MKKFMEIHHSTPVPPVPNTTVDGNKEVTAMTTPESCNPITPDNSNDNGKEENAMTTTPESRNNIAPDNSNDNGKEENAMTTTPESRNNITPDNSNDNGKEENAMTTPENSSNNNVESKMMEMIRHRLGICKEDTATPKKPETPEQDKNLEIIQRKLEGMMKYLGISFSDEEKSTLLNFLTQDSVAEKAAGARFALWPEGHSFLQEGLSSDEERIDGNGTDGAFAIMRKSKDGKSIMNLCIPALTKKLRCKEYEPNFRRALADWVIYTQKLQVAGWKVNPELDKSMVVTSDQEYLEKVLNEMMASEAIQDIMTAIATHDEYPDVYTTSIVIGQNYQGDGVVTLLFRTDAMKHASKMAYAFKDEDTCVDLIQGKCSKLTVAGDTFAAFDFDRPSCYLARGKKGLRPNIYLPEWLFAQFLNVTV